MEREKKKKKKKKYRHNKEIKSSGINNMKQKGQMSTNDIIGLLVISNYYFQEACLENYSLHTYFI